MRKIRIVSRNKYRLGYMGICRVSWVRFSVRGAAGKRVDMRIRMCILNEEGTMDLGRSRKEKNNL